MYNDLNFDGVTKLFVDNESVVLDYSIAFCLLKDAGIDIKPNDVEFVEEVLQGFKSKLMDNTIDTRIYVKILDNIINTKDYFNEQLKERHQDIPTCGELSKIESKLETGEKVEFDEEIVRLMLAYLGKNVKDLPKEDFISLTDKTGNKRGVLWGNDRFWSNISVLCSKAGITNNLIYRKLNKRFIGIFSEEGIAYYKYLVLEDQYAETFKKRKYLIDSVRRKIKHEEIEAELEANRLERQRKIEEETAKVSADIEQRKLQRQQERNEYEKEIQQLQYERTQMLKERAQLQQEREQLEVEKARKDTIQRDYDFEQRRQERNSEQKEQNYKSSVRDLHEVANRERERMHRERYNRSPEQWIKDLSRGFTKTPEDREWWNSLSEVEQAETILDFAQDNREALREFNFERFEAYIDELRDRDYYDTDESEYYDTDVVAEYYEDDTTALTRDFIDTVNKLEAEGSTDGLLSSSPSPSQNQGFGGGGFFGDHSIFDGLGNFEDFKNSGHMFRCIEPFNFDTYTLRDLHFNTDYMELLKGIYGILARDLKNQNKGIIGKIVSSVSALKDAINLSELDKQVTNTRFNRSVLIDYYTPGCVVYNSSSDNTLNYFKNILNLAGLSDIVNSKYELAFEFARSGLPLIDLNETICEIFASRFQQNFRQVHEKYWNDFLSSIR